MAFAHGQMIERLRGRPLEDRYSGQDRTFDWEDPQVAVVPDSWVDRSASRRFTDLTRSQISDLLSLYCNDHDFELLVTDRIRVGGEGGRVYEIEGIPTPEVNPFTGWVPPLEVPLGRAVG